MIAGMANGKGDVAADMDIDSDYISDNQNMVSQKYKKYSFLLLTYF
ncbi:MAG: hypothetical protein K0R19_3559 [Bacillota bacterium]|jgi:hypothetical protein|nr:hypothetical protein [Bacillota bacterium]